MNRTIPPSRTPSFSAFLRHSLLHHYYSIILCQDGRDSLTMELPDTMTQKQLQYQLGALVDDLKQRKSKTAYPMPSHTHKGSNGNGKPPSKSSFRLLDAICDLIFHFGLFTHVHGVVFLRAQGRRLQRRHSLPAQHFTGAASIHDHPLGSSINHLPCVAMQIRYRSARRKLLKTSGAAC